MVKEVKVRWMSVLLIAIIIMSGFLSVMLSNKKASDFPKIGKEGRDWSTVFPSSEIDMNAQCQQRENMEKVVSKIQPTLMNKIEKGWGKDTLSRVFIATNNINELTNLLLNYNCGVKIESESYHNDEVRVPLLEVPSSLIPEIASLPSVLYISEYTTPIPQTIKSSELFHEADNKEEWIPCIGGLPQPYNINSTMNHGAQKAWESGFTGEGVRVAIPDMGIDFAHPELQGTQARITDPSSPYYGWPIVFDPSSMSSYLSSGGDVEETWYVDTSSTDLNVTHTITIDGKSDFWEDGNELVSKAYYEGTAMMETELAFANLYVTQDKDNWYIGFWVLSKEWNMTYGIYIDTDNTTNSGGNEDPLGKFVNATKQHLPEAVLYVNHTGILWGVGKEGDVWSENDTLEESVLFTWKDGVWEGNKLKAMGGEEGYSESKFAEFSIPKDHLNDADTISIELFTTGKNKSHAQDTLPYDLSVLYDEPDWTNTITTLSNFATIGYGFWRYDIRANPKLPISMSWRGMYEVPFCYNPRIGRYHPDENFEKKVGFEHPVAVLLADPEEAGNYTTVFVDLDNDRDFTDEKPCTKGDEISYYDWYDPAYGIRDVAWSPNGSWIASTGNDHTVRIWVWNATTNEFEESRIINPNSGRIISITFSPDGSKIAAGTFKNVTKVWNVLSGELILDLDGHTGPIYSVDWSPDGNKIVTGSSDKTIRIWNASNGEELSCLVNHTAAVNSVDWSYNIIASGSADGNITIWDPSIGGVIGGFSENNGIVNEVAFSPNGTWLGSVSDEGSLIVRNISTGAIQWKQEWPDMRFLSLSWSYNGEFIVISRQPLKGAPDVQTYYADSGGIISTFGEAEANIITSVAFNPNGTWLDPTGFRQALARSSIWEDTNKNYGGCVYLYDQYDGFETKFFGCTYGGTYDFTRYDRGDGIADVSGGMIYFIADGETPIPYSDVYAEKNPSIENHIPGNGELVTFMGAFAKDGIQGTEMASTIVGQGALPTIGPGEIAHFGIKGMAPDAKIIAVGDIYTTNFLDGLYFAVEGYDGIPGTGDEASIVSIGFNFPSYYEDGLDFYSRVIDLIAESGKEYTSFVASAGNSGYGYGTCSSPASASNVISVGASSDYSYRSITKKTPTEAWEEGTNPSYGDITYFSGRGPSALGQPEPNVVANGRMAFGAYPLNIIPLGVDEWGDGVNQWDSWQGGSMSCAGAAGILALIYDAYAKEHNGDYPNAIMAKNLLMSSADNLNYDTLAQGAGFVNGDRGTKIANNIDGISVNKSYWVPGDYHGEECDMFVKLMEKGESATTTFEILNHNKLNDADVSISTDIFQKTGAYNYSHIFVTETDDLVFIILNPQSVYHQSYGLPVGIYEYNALMAGAPPLIEINETIYENADLTKITAHTQIYMLDPELDGILNYLQYLDVYDWTEKDVTWPFPGSDGVPDFGAYGDLNRMAFDARDSNLLECRVHDMIRRTHDGVLINVGGYNLYGEQNIGAPGIEWIVEVEFFNKTKWSWADTTPTTLYIGPLESDTFNATLNVPSDAGIGSYEGGIYINNSGNITTIPVLINIGGTLENFTFGGDVEGTDALFGNKIHGGFGAGGQDGDWRFYYIDIPDQGLYTSSENTRFLIDVNWEKIQTDNDIYVFGRGGSSQGISFDSERYGPYMMENKGGSEETSTFFTTTGGPKEVTSPPITGGLNIIAVRNIRWNGTVHEESISGEASTMSISSTELKFSLNKLYGEKSITLSSSREWKGIGGIAGGPSPPESYEEISIPQDSVDWIATQDDFLKALSMGSYTKLITVQSTCLILNVHIWGDEDCPDLDLGLYLDGKDPGNVPNGIAEAEEFIAYCADADADEEIKLIKPSIADDPDTPDINEAEIGATYIIKVLGYTIPKGIGHFDMDITIVQGKGFDVDGKGEDSVQDDPSVFINSDTILPYNKATLNISWDLPGSTEDTTLMGAFYVGPGNAPYCYLVPIELTIDRLAPTISSFDVNVDPPGDPTIQLNYLDNTTTNDNTPALTVRFTDASIITETTLEHIAPKHLWGCPSEHWKKVPKTIEVDRGELDSSTIKMYVDGMDVTPWADIKVPFYQKDPDGIPNSGDEIYGYWTGSITYTPTTPLSEGGHCINVTVGDLAGNIATAYWTFTIDTQAPYLAIDTPSADISTNVNITIISGTTTPDSTLFIRGNEVEVEEDGSFSKEEELVEGENKIEIKSVDWFDMSPVGEPVEGNTAVITRVITLDTTKPQFSRITTSTTSITNKDSTTIIGKIEDERNEDIILNVNDVIITVNSDGTFIATLPLEKEGENEITIIATDPAGNTNVTSRTIIKDTIAPILTVEALTPNAQGRLNVKGTTELGAILTINGKPVPVVNGAFSKEIELGYGPNLIVIESKDAAGNVEEIREVVMYSSMPLIGFLPLSLISMIVLLLIGLLIGYVLLGRIRSGKKIEEEEEVGEELELEEEEIGEEEPEEELEAEEEIEKEAERKEEDMGKDSEEEKEELVEEKEGTKEEAPEKDLEELGKELFGEE